MSEDEATLRHGPDPKTQRDLRLVLVAPGGAILGALIYSRHEIGALAPAPASLRPPRSGRLQLVQRQRDRLQRGEVELLRGAVYVEADDVAALVEIGVEPGRDLPRLARRRVAQLDVEAVRLRIMLQLHWPSSRNPRSMKALWIVADRLTDIPAAHAPG